MRSEFALASLCRDQESTTGCASTANSASPRPLHTGYTVTLKQQGISMYVLYDTRSVHPLDRYEHVQAGVAAELAPVAIHGRAPGKLVAVMAVTEIGEFKIEAVTWAADTELAGHRTDRLIRVRDPECYRIFLSVNGGARMDQAGTQVLFRARDIALYDLSRPWQATHPTGPTSMQLVMLTFPRALIPMARAVVAPLVGTALPRSLPGRSLVAQFLIELAGTSVDQEDEPALAAALHECAVGLIRQRLSQPFGFTPRTRQLLRMASFRTILRRHLNDPTFDPDRLAEIANVSPRYLYKVFQEAGTTPMQLLKRLRLEASHRSLRDPSMADTPVKTIMAVHGYLRPDQFARDFKQYFGVSPAQVRGTAAQGGSATWSRRSSREPG
ncbi:AraC family transcriptional regulator [Solwaraspora sp. WMMD406]|uniref:helix-turn-helix domain-containing protein n=1 Tax=Solwaraspora sp. WMMD406 TaxID=3016095 RepID=UPI0024175823|nr:AraC family transcriptional regulator [Solwaraspora sp. WMMD406]MDG4765574.1 AraC family transcriptional regulator [Solwaraspora sp. WMMD406]